MNKIFKFIKEATDDDLIMLTTDLQTLIIDMYFSKYWKGNTQGFEKSGSVLVDKVNNLKPQSVLDVGCGYNPYKGKIDNLVGIDPFNTKADVQQNVVQYQYFNQDKQYDVVLALGSVNFGNRNKILTEIEAIDKLTKPGGYQFWRVNPGLEHNCPEFPLVNLIDFFPWDKQFIDGIANVYGYNIIEYDEEHNTNGDKRLFFCFHKY